VVGGVGRIRLDTRIYCNLHATNSGHDIAECFVFVDKKACNVERRLSLTVCAGRGQCIL
jgi:hypothetical protein